MSVSVNGTDLATLGFRVRERRGDLTAAVGAPPAVAVPGGFGARATGASAAPGPRRLELVGRLEAASAAALETALATVLTVCLGAAGGPTAADVTLVLGAAGASPTRQWTAALADAVVQRRAPTGLTPVADLTLVFEARDPLSYDASVTTLALSTAVARGALGTAWSWPVVALAGAFSGARTITLVDGADATVRTLTVTVPSSTVLSGHTVEVDMLAETVTHVHGGVRDARASWLTGGDFVALDPAHRVGGTEPGLRLDAGTGTATYRRAWR